MTDGGYKKRGSLAVSKIDAAGFYYLNIEGEPGHALKCILQVRFQNLTNVSLNRDPIKLSSKSCKFAMCRSRYGVGRFDVD